MRRAALAAAVLVLSVVSCGPRRSATSSANRPSTPEAGECPPEMVKIVADGRGAYCIDRYEASLVEITEDGERPFSPYDVVKDQRVRAVSKKAAMPQAYISANRARAACEASNKRLCSEAEWNTACRGTHRTAFPYGEARASGACNDAGKSPLVALYSYKGAHAFDPGPMNDPRLNQQPNTLAPSGSYTRCTNDFGVFDMVGNLHEWIDDPNGTFRGGYYLDTHLNGDGCSYRTTAHGRGYHDYSTGFRCCADAP